MAKKQLEEITLFGETQARQISDKTARNNIGTLSQLKTTEKTNVVAAINELQAGNIKISNGEPDDVVYVESDGKLGTMKNPYVDFSLKSTGTFSKNNNWKTDGDYIKKYFITTTAWDAYWFIAPNAGKFCLSKLNSRGTRNVFVVRDYTQQDLENIKIVQSDSTGYTLTTTNWRKENIASTKTWIDVEKGDLVLISQSGGENVVNHDPDYACHIKTNIFANEMDIAQKWIENEVNNLQGQLDANTDQIAAVSQAANSYTDGKVSTVEDSVKQVADVVNETVNVFHYTKKTYDTNRDTLRQLYIRPNVSDNYILTAATAQPKKRTLIIPCVHNAEYKIHCSGTYNKNGAAVLTDKRVATYPIDPTKYTTVTSQGPQYSTPGSMYIQFKDDVTFKTTDVDNYIAIQFAKDGQSFTEDEMLSSLSITYTTAIDTVARQIAKDNANRGVYHSEMLDGLHIVEDAENTYVDDSIIASADFHAAVAQYAATTTVDGRRWLTVASQEDSGVDGKGNLMRYYKTVPPRVIFKGRRLGTTPPYLSTITQHDSYTDAQPVVLITSNMHYREKNGNYAVFQMLKNIFQNRETDPFMKFLYKNVSFVWIPCCCPQSSSQNGYANADGKNVNRSFPQTIDGACECQEAEYVKSVFDMFANQAILHLDVHTFKDLAGYSTWTFTDDEKLGRTSALAMYDVLQAYREKYADDEEHKASFSKDCSSFYNMATTSSNYMQRVHGVPAATIEAYGSLNKWDVSFLHDLILNVIVSMLK